MVRRFLLKAAALVVVFVAVAVLAVYLYLRRSLPSTNGVVQVAGISTPVDIVRDADAIPHIFASTKADGLFGLGYVHAQDRLWQMEFQRRIGFGRLSEIFGAAALPQDRFLRTVGFGRAAKSAWANMPKETRAPIDAYVAGINAFLAERRRAALPPEFALLRFEPEPWTGADVIVWQKMMAWDLSANYSFELLRHDIAAKVGASALDELMPQAADFGTSILGLLDPSALSARSGTQGGTPAPRDQTQAGSWLGNRPATTAPGTWAEAVTSAVSTGPAGVAEFLLGGTRTESLGSNNWVVDGTQTASGKPLLANDPHLSARVPSIWYLAHVSAGDYDAIGASLPGAPGIILGRNRFIAWGATNVGADVEDLYREKLDESGRFAEFQNHQEPLQVVPETIVVKGQSPVQIEVRITRHGPLVSDAINAVNAATPKRRSLPPLEPLAFRWSALDSTDLTVAALLKVGDARNWDEFNAAFHDFVVPSQNFVYADVEGHIGYLAPGRIPIRSQGDGAMPVEGWTGASEWTGWVPFEQLPRAFDPPGHVIVTANQRVYAGPQAPFLGLDWPEPYRARRISELLRKPRLTTDDFASMERDTLSLHARDLLPVLLDRVVPSSAGDQEAIRVLKRWNYEAGGGSPAAAIFEAWFLHLAPAIAGDDLGALLTENYQGRFTYVTRFVRKVLAAAAATSTASTTQAPSAQSRSSGRTISRISTSGVDEEGGSRGQARGQQQTAASHTTATSSRNWCDDQRTPQIETCADTVSEALHQAVADLTRQLGADMSRWRWDAVHRVTFPHQGLDSVAALRPLLSRALPGAGDWSTVNVGAVAADQPYEQHSISSYREIIDLSPANDSRFIDAVGQSGHFLSPHYDDFLPDWKAVKHKPLRMSRTDAERNAIGTLRLTPAPAGQ